MIKEAGDGPFKKQIQYYDWQLQVTLLVLTNQTIYFQDFIAMLI